MGLFQNAVATYDAMEGIAGQYIIGKTVLAPIAHMTAKASIEITIDQNGSFVQAQKVDCNVLFPATEESAGRSGTRIAPHPLCDQLCYILPLDAEKHRHYMDQQEDWIQSAFGHPKVYAVHQYLKHNTIIQDLEKADLLAFDENGKLKNEKDFVCWTVLAEDGTSGPVWTDLSLMQAFADYYLSKLEAGEKGVCIINGNIAPIAHQHLKGVVPVFGNAKLISSNDTANFTYRGRFTDEKEAVGVSYIASQKAHNALKWLVANEGIRLGAGRTLICWNPSGKVIPKPHSSLLKRNEVKVVPSAYKSELEKVIWGYKKELAETDQVVTAIFDAATTGRLSIGYYNDISAADFLDRLQYWDETFCWYDTRWGTETPSLFDTIEYAYGTKRNGQMAVDDKLESQALQRMVMCRIDRQAFPLDMMRCLTYKADNLQIYEEPDRSRLVFIACAAIRKYKMDHFKEECEMALEPKNPDRSYQFGRLLAVMEKIERDTYLKGEEREPNAVRMQSVFIKRPGYATSLIMNQIKQAYYPRLTPGARSFYERVIGEIMDSISESGDENYNKALQETYLLGYYLQKNELYTKKETLKEE